MDFLYINNTKDFELFLQEVKDCELIAIDTEFTFRTTYFPILSIIQIATLNKNGKKSLFIIDCLSDLNLQDFYSVVADEKIIKILHCPKQDLQIFKQKSQLSPKNIVDTQLMANFCSMSYNIGYAGLVEEFLGIKLDKFEQNSDWQKRPLSPSQINYALLDVEYLHEIYFSLKDKLQNLGRLSWLEEEMSVYVDKMLQDSNENLFKDYFLRKKATLKFM